MKQQWQKLQLCNLYQLETSYISTINIELNLQGEMKFKNLVICDHCTSYQAIFVRRAFLGDLCCLVNQFLDKQDTRVFLYLPQLILKLVQRIRDEHRYWKFRVDTIQSHMNGKFKSLVPVVVSQHRYCRSITQTSDECNKESLRPKEQKSSISYLLAFL